MKKKRGATNSIHFQGGGAIGLEDPPPITEDDINKGMISLLNKGIIPKDVDLTPAFEKGAPPVTCKGVKFYAKEEKNVRRDVQVGGTQTHTVRYDLQAPEESGGTSYLKSTMAS